jgi:hypothetical protein
MFDPTETLLSGGHTTTIADAASLVAYPLFLPQDPGLPAPQVWVVHEIGEDGSPLVEAAVRYDSSLILTYAHWPSGADPASSYVKEAADWHAGYVTTIAGNPAWVVPANENDEDSSVNGIHVSIGEVEVNLLGRIPLKNLLSDASTLTAA